MAGGNGRKVEPKRPEYDKLSKDDLIGLLRRRDAMAEKKVGLIWDRECIARDGAVNNNFVVMDADPNLHCGKGPFDNLVIEGDNYDSLRWLNMTHKGKIQCIYIDPPYNTGAPDATFCYADKFEDSQWLEMLAIRLRLAKDLLSEDGVILVSIDDEHRALLDLLMEEIFSKTARMGSFVWKKRSGAMDSGNLFSDDHEHILVYANPKFRFLGVQKDFKNYKDNVQLGPLTQNKTYQERPNAYYPILDTTTDIWYPCNPDRVWCYASEAKNQGKKLRSDTMEEHVRQGRINFPNDGFYLWRSVREVEEAIDSGNVPKSNNIPLLRRSLIDEGVLDPRWYVGKKIGKGRPLLKRSRDDVRDTVQPVSSWIRHRVDQGESNELACSSNREGTHTLQKIFHKGGVFNHPKPPSLLVEVLRQATKRDSIVLDFFAGSGTAAHAVLALNAEDGGKRRFIMCSEQNGKNLCSDVLAERVQRVINGYADVKGTGGNFAYLRSRTVPMEYVPLGTAVRGAKLADVQIWSLIQAMHGLPLQAKAMHAVTDSEAIIYSPVGAKEDISLVRSLVKRKAKVTVYSWRPNNFASFNQIRIETPSDVIMSRFPT